MEVKMKFILRLAINMVALYVAIVALKAINGVTFQDNWSWVNLIWLALIFGLVNAFLRVPFKALSCLLIILTLGLFTLVINTLLFAITVWVGTHFSIGFTLNQPWFLYAFLGSLVTTVVSGFLSLVLRDELKGRRHAQRKH
jgi:putative membrane protein